MEKTFSGECAYDAKVARLNNAPAPLRFGLVGTGWRAEFFMRLARQLPDLFELVGVATRSAEKAKSVSESFGVPTATSANELVDYFAPEFVVVCVSRDVAPNIIAQLNHRGMPVLAETPPASDTPSMRALWNDLASPSLVQVCEQYVYLPKLLAYRAAIASGRLGDVTSAQVSWTHEYHAIAMLRNLLGVGHDPSDVVASSFNSLAVSSVGRDGWPDAFDQISVTQTIATLDFGSRVGVYDFTDGQWFHPLMSRRLTVRGTRGEIVNDTLTVLMDPHTPVTATLVRRETGIDGNLEGHDLDYLSIGGDVLYRNPFVGARLSDEEIAIASVVSRMGLWTRGEAEAPYPLAQACQDHALAQAILQAAKTHKPVRVENEPWATDLAI